MTADALAIAGLVPLSSVDWPGRLVATVFCQGCPWNCGYCHNPALIPPRKAGEVPWSAVTELLARRHGLLDGVVFTGGEALRQAALPAAIAEVRALGFEVGLHSSGAFPARLRDALPLVDWVGLDVKALPEHCAEVVGRPGAGERAWQSLDALVAAAREHGVGYEVRTTIAPGVTADGALELARRCRERGVREFALQQARPTGARSSASVTAPGWDERFAAIAAGIGELGFERLSVRPAA